MRKLMIAALLLAAPLSLAACNTVEGIGKDTQRAGKALERAAKKHTD
jgi:predicted small secreted protein